MGFFLRLLATEFIFIKPTEVNTVDIFYKWLINKDFKGIGIEAIKCLINNYLQFFISCEPAENRKVSTVLEAGLY